MPDLRNSKVVDLVNRLREHGYAVDVHDPLADPAEAAELYGIALLPTLPEQDDYDAVSPRYRTAPTPGSTPRRWPDCSVRAACSPISRGSGASASCRKASAAGRS